MWPSVVGALYSGQVVVGGDGIDVGADDDDDEYKSIYLPLQKEGQ